MKGKGESVTAKLLVFVMLLTLCMVYVPAIDGKAAGTTTITYNSYVQSYGWIGWKSNGALSGKTGESKRLEGINIKLKNKTTTGSIKYRTYVQTYGWKPWVTEGNYSGTKGESKRIEAIQIKLTGKMANAYDVYYRVHAQSYGWLAWAKNGANAGTQGLGKRIEAIQIILVKKGGAKPGNIGGVKSVKTDSCVTKAMVDKEWRNAYTSLVKQQYSEGSWYTINLIDIDKDGIPEMLVNGEQEENNSIYIYSGGKVKKAFVSGIRGGIGSLYSKNGNYYLQGEYANECFPNGAMHGKTILLYKSGNTIGSYFTLETGGYNKHIAAVYDLFGNKVAEGTDSVNSFLGGFGLSVNIYTGFPNSQADGSWYSELAQTWVYSVGVQGFDYETDYVRGFSGTTLDDYVSYILSY